MINPILEKEDMIN